MKKYQSVFLIDDDEITNYINRNIIVGLGITQLIFYGDNGREGLKLLKENCKDNQPDSSYLIFLDLNMPVMDGKEFLVEFNNNRYWRNCCDIILLTNTKNIYDNVTVQEYNLLGLINKPLNPQKIEHTLSIVLD